MQQQRMQQQQQRVQHTSHFALAQSYPASAPPLCPLLHSAPPLPSHTSHPLSTHHHPPHRRPCPPPCEKGGRVQRLQGVGARQGVEQETPAHQTDAHALVPRVSHSPHTLHPQKRAERKRMAVVLHGVYALHRVCVLHRVYVLHRVCVCAVCCPCSELHI